MIERLLGIIYILMSKETVTAGELAERFEVSACILQGTSGIPAV